MRKQTRSADYICENNLVILMNWWVEVTEHWKNVNTSVTEKEGDEYNTLQMMMDNIIIRMRLKILLNKMQDLL